MIENSSPSAYGSYSYHVFVSLESTAPLANTNWDDRVKAQIHGWEIIVPKAENIITDHDHIFVTKLENFHLAMDGFYSEKEFGSVRMFAG